MENGRPHAYDQDDVAHIRCLKVSRLATKRKEHYFLKYKIFWYFD